MRGEAGSYLSNPGWAVPPNCRSGSCERGSDSLSYKVFFSEPMAEPEDLNKLEEFEPVSDSDAATDVYAESEPPSPLVLLSQNRIKLGLVLIGVVVLGAYLWSGAKSGFPKIAAGSYIGSISIPGAKQVSSTFKFYLERSSADDELLFIVLREGWLPQKVLPATQSSSDMSFPVTISGKDGSFRFEGRQLADGQYAGKVIYIDSGRVGTWTISPVKVEPKDSTDKETNQVRDWLLLKAGLVDAVARYESLSQNMAKQKAEIDSLSGYVTEGGDLKARAAKKLDGIKREQSDARQLLERKQKEAKELEDKIEIAESVTRMGRLVSLSRESLEREARWADSMLRSIGDYSVSDSGPGPDQTDPSAKIKQSIDLERERISRLEQLLGNGASNFEDS